MIDAVFYFGAMSLPIGIVIVATRRAMRQIEAQFSRAEEHVR